jgi:hypothetical protein
MGKSCDLIQNIKTEYNVSANSLKLLFEKIHALSVVIDTRQKSNVNKTTAVAGDEKY